MLMSSNWSRTLIGKARGAKLGKPLVKQAQRHMCGFVKDFPPPRTPAECAAAAKKSSHTPQADHPESSIVSQEAKDLDVTRKESKNKTRPIVKPPPITLQSSPWTAGYSMTKAGITTASLEPKEYNTVSLSKPLPGFPTPIYAKPTKDDQEARVTTLKNGLRVASQQKFGQFCTVGVAIDSGSRYEVNYPSGISHFLEKLAFNSTPYYQDRDQILQELEQYGGICDCQASRDTLIYAASVETGGLEPVIRMLSEVILRPLFTNEEIQGVKNIINFELEDLEMKPDKEPQLFEMIHAAAYRSNTLGLPKICPRSNIETIDRGILLTYLKHHHTPERMVLAGVGCDHEALVEMAEKHFVEKEPIWEATENQNLISPDITGPDLSIAQYTGGIEAVEADLSSVSLGPTPMPELAHFVLGFESGSHHNLEDFIPVCVLNMIMGGGGSFSAGGPGKGMYTRLYTHVLNRYHWIHNATAYNHAYNDTGLFCIHCSASPNMLRDLINVIIREAINMAHATMNEVELNRAKKQLQSMLLMNLESRPVLFEDVARQVLANGHRKNPQYFIDCINQVTEDDIRRVALKMLKSRASVAALGNLKQLPSLEDIETALVSKDGRVPRRFTLLRGNH